MLAGSAAAQRGAPLASYVVLMPAHNEEDIIADRLAALQSQLPAHMRILLVADNCSDRTATVARAAAGSSTWSSTGSGAGSCRDFSLLMIEAVRSLGFAARFVSGYQYDPATDYGTVHLSTQLQRVVLLLASTLVTALVVARMQRLVHLSGTDGLTGLHNRRYLDTKAAKLGHMMTPVAEPAAHDGDAVQHR